MIIYILILITLKFCYKPRLIDAIKNINFIDNNIIYIIIMKKLNPKYF